MSSIMDDGKTAQRVVIQTIFVVQICLVLVIFSLIGLGYWLENGLLVTLGFCQENDPCRDRGFGFFWFSFLAGCVGASLGALKRIRGDAQFAVELAQSRITTLMPVLYGGLMAGVAYLLFMSGILSGDGGNGLLTTNLFPNFTAATAARASLSEYLAMRPTTMADAGKLTVWCFLAGYSERFVAGILGQLEQRTARSEERP